MNKIRSYMTFRSVDDRASEVFELEKSINEVKAEAMELAKEINPIIRKFENHILIVEKAVNIAKSEEKKSENIFLLDKLTDKLNNVNSIYLKNIGEHKKKLNDIEKSIDNLVGDHRVKERVDYRKKLQKADDSFNNILSNYEKGVISEDILNKAYDSYTQLTGISKGGKDDKFATVMREFKQGKLKSSSGDKVTDRKQAIAIAASEAGISKADSDHDMQHIQEMIKEHQRLVDVLSPHSKMDKKVEKELSIQQSELDKYKEQLQQIKRKESIAKVQKAFDLGLISEEILQKAKSSEPTEAQKLAGNYKKDKVKVNGLEVSIENKKGSERSGIGEGGKSWKVKMNNDYGYFNRTKGKDGDHIDVFLSEKPEEGKIFIIDQSNQKGDFDEHKVMMGFASEKDALDNYKSNYEKDFKVKYSGISEVSVETLKKWLNLGSKGKKLKPYSELKKSIEILEESEIEDLLEKGRSGIYSDNAENRKLGRVGKRYGSIKNNFDKISNYFVEILSKKGYNLSVNKSKTSFGESWYLKTNIGHETYQVRISDHSVGTIRLKNDPTIMYINSDSSNYKEKAIEVVSIFDKIKKYKEDRDKEFDKIKNIEEYYKNKKEKVLSTLNKEKYLLSVWDRTSKTLEEVKTQNPNWKYIKQTNLGNGFYKYEYIKKDNSDYAKKWGVRNNNNPSNDYTDYLLDNLKELEKSNFNYFYDNLFFGNISKDIVEDIQKSRSGTYINTVENRKLNRVGQKYGTTGDKETTSTEKTTQPEKEENKNTDSVEEQAKIASGSALETASKEAKDPEVRSAAHKELDRRESEEKVKKPGEDSPDKVPEEESKETDKDTKDLDSMSNKEIRDFYIQDSVDSVNYLHENFIEKKALDLYTEEGFEHIRNFISTGKAKEEVLDLKDGFQFNVNKNTLNTAIGSISKFIKNNTIKQDITLHRRVDLSGTTKDFFSKLKKGDVYQDDSFSSTALRGIARFGDFNIEIRAKKGSKVANVGNPSEIEYLIDKGSKFKVLDTSTKGIIVELL